MPASCSRGAPRDYLGPVAEFGEKIGIAFQLVDDVIDLSDQAEETGKKAGTDLRAGVVTLPVLYLRREAQTDVEAAALLADIDRIVEATASNTRPARRATVRGGLSAALDTEFADVVRRLREHDVTHRTRTEAHRWADEASAALDALPYGPVKKALTRFADRWSSAPPDRPVPPRLRPTAPPSTDRRTVTATPSHHHDKRDTRDHLRLAIVGAGPAGIYAADILLKAEKAFDVSIDLFEQLPAPYGLVRYGVAPDHPRIKGIVNALRDVLDSGDIRVFGNVRYGVDIRLDDLKKHYNAVIFSTGAIKDADLDIPGIDLEGSYGAADFVSWFDGHPDFPRTWPLDAQSVAVVGVGNVALDVSRILAKHADDLLPTEIPDNVYEGLKRRPSPTCTSSAAAGPRRSSSRRSSCASSARCATST